MPNYHQYIKSQAWYAKHPGWLKQANYRCMMFPWITIGKTTKGRYHRYQTHHAHYRNVGKERLGRDVLMLSPVAHQLIYHCLLSGGVRRAGKQKVFPNFAQRVANFWCNLPLFLKTWLLYLLGAIAVVVVLSEALSSFFFL